MLARNTKKCSHFSIREMQALSLFSVQHLFLCSTSFCAVPFSVQYLFLCSTSSCAVPLPVQYLFLCSTPFCAVPLFVQYLFAVRRRPKEMLLAREKPELRRFFWKWGISFFYVRYELVARQKPKKVTVGGLRNNLSLS
jgi:hypothetical protein